MSRFHRAPRLGRNRPLRHAVASAFAAAAALFTSLVLAQTPLTLAEAQRLAIARSGQLAARDFSVTASREMAVAAGQRPDPMLKLGVENLPADGPERFSFGRDFMTMRQIGVMQELTRPDKLKLRAQRYEIEAERNAADKEAAVIAINRDVALAWLDRYFAETAASLIAQQAREANLDIEAADSAYRSGRGSQSDVFMARAATVTLEDRADELARRANAAKSAMVRWIGSDALLPLGTKPVLDSIPADVAGGEHLHDLHPQIESANKQEEMALVDARLAEANKKADWSVELMYSVRGSAFSNMVSVGVSVPLQWDRPRRQDREVAAKLALARQAAAERDDMLRIHDAQLRGLAAEWENARERSRRYEARLLPLAKERTQAALAAYRGGKANLADVVAARRAEIESRIEALQRESEAARLWAQLNYFVHDETSMSTARPTSAAIGGMK